MDPGGVSVEDKPWSESSPVLENMENNVNEAVTATLKLGKVRFLCPFACLFVEKMERTESWLLD